MLGHIAAFEWRYQVKSPVFWVGCFFFFMLAFGATASDVVQIGSVGNVHKNSPYVILQYLGVMSTIAVFIIVAMVSNVVIRDDETGFAPILRSTSISKTAYLVGRFSGACAAAFFVLAAVPLGVLVGSWMPWIDPEKIGPFHASHYLYALFVEGLPTLIIVSAAFFALATATRSMMWTYVGAVGFLVLYLVMRISLRDPAYDVASALADPFGGAAFGIATKYWTAADRNTLLPPIAGLLLANRLLWIGVGAAVFLIAAKVFSFEERPSRLSRRERIAARNAAAIARAGRASPAVGAIISDPDFAAAQALLPQREAPARRERAALPDIPPATAATRRAQWWALARHDMAFVFRSPAFFVLLLIALLNSGASLWFTGDFYGSGTYPVTRLMVSGLDGAYTLFPLIIAIYYGGELVWRDRERRIHEIVDATAAPDWTHVVPKVIAISLVLFSTALIGVLAGVVVQTIKHYFRFELLHYAAWFVWPATLTLIQFAVLSVFVQVLVPQKYLGWAVMVAYVIANISLSSIGFEHHLYDYAGGPNVPLSDFNGASRFWIGALWFQIYWSAFAVILVVLAHALWRRGNTFELRPRLKRLGHRLHGTAGVIMAAAGVVFVATGAWIYYNADVLNRYITAPDHDRLLADYEKALLKFETVPQPKISDVTLDVELYPKQVRAVTTGQYTIVNRTAAPIDVLHLAWDERLSLDKVVLDGATVQTDYPRFHYRIYKLATPMKPGESRTLGFTTTLGEPGFVNQKPYTRIVDNGTFLDNTLIAPRIGVSRNGLLQERSKRRKYGLEPQLRPPKLEDDSARAFNEFNHDSDWVNAEITVGTDADQVAVAPGYLQSDITSTVNGEKRRVMRFKTDAPTMNFFSVQSARYAIQHATTKVGDHDVDLAVYYTPGHDYNVERMMNSMRLSLALFSEQFSPFQFHQLRIIEFPAYERFAQSFPNTIPFSEDIHFLGEYPDPDKIDVATYVTAHEVAHQWWGHQLVPADQQGASMLVETFAQYSAMLVMERKYGRDQVRKFLKYELDRYLRSRGGEVVEELPLARVEEQQYIHYQKGSLVMYWLKEVVGEDVVNRSLAKLLQQYSFKGAPYPNTRDFLAILRSEAGPQHDALITDLFEKITLLDLKATNAVAKQRPDGKWDVSIDYEAHKHYADGKGVETEAPMDELVEFGVFTAKPGDKGFGAGNVLLLQKVQVTTGTHHVDFVVDRPPVFAGIDPYNKRIDRNTDDNVVKVNGS
jgi:aminopeptidase N